MKKRFSKKVFFEKIKMFFEKISEKSFFENIFVHFFSQKMPTEKTIFEKIKLNSRKLFERSEK